MISRVLTFLEESPFSVSIDGRSDVLNCKQRGTRDCSTCGVEVIKLNTF